MSRLFWALMIGLALGGPPLQSWVASLFEGGRASAGMDAGGIFDPDGGATPDAGNQFDPDGSVVQHAGGRFDPDGATTDAGNQFDPNG